MGLQPGISQSVKQMVDELLIRVPLQLGTTRGLYYINRSIRYWDCQASYFFNSDLLPNMIPLLTNGIGIFPAATLPSDIDLGKDLYMFLTGMGTKPYPISRSLLNEFGVRGIYDANNTQVTTIPDHYTIIGQDIYIYPYVNSTFSIFYHKNTQPVLYSSMSYTNYPDDFDDVILDWSEAELKRIYGLIGWQLILTRANEQGKMLIDQYRTNTELVEGQVAAGANRQNFELVKAQ